MNTDLVLNNSSAPSSLSLSPRTPTLPSPPQATVSMSVTTGGVLSIQLNKQQVCSGSLTINGQTPELVGAEQPDPNHIKINQVYEVLKISVVWTINLFQNDLTITSTIYNVGTTPFTGYFLYLPAFTFSKTPTGTMTTWHWTYLQARGLQVYFPSYMQPIGCVYAADTNYALSIYSSSENQILFNASFVSDGVLPNPLPIEAHIVNTIIPGDSQQATLVIRLTTDSSAAGLLSGYKKAKANQFLTHYQPVPQGATAFQSIDASWVTPSNPGGYNGDARRIDTMDGVTKYLAWQIPRLQSQKQIGIIFWSPGGYQASSMYPLDYDINLQKIEKTWPYLVSGFKHSGYRVGIAARFGEFINPDGLTGYRMADPMNPNDINVMIKRIDYCVKMGIDMWYIDSAGQYPADSQMIQIARAHLGPKHLFFSEYATETTLPFSGVYCEWLGQGTRWMSELTRSHLRYLFDDKSTWLCVDKSGGATPVDLSPMGFQTLIGDWTPQVP